MPPVATASRGTRAPNSLGDGLRRRRSHCGLELVGNNYDVIGRAAHRHWGRGVFSL